jgi:hypothetical protein
MKILRILILVLFVGISSQVFAQWGVTSYSIYSFGVNTSQNKKISFELKVFGNQYIDQANVEADLFYNFRETELHQFSIGLGINVLPLGDFDRIHSIVVPFQLQIFPLREMKRLSFLIEITPEYIPEETLNLRHLLGVRYRFSD